MHILITQKPTEEQLSAIRELLPEATITVTREEEEIRQAMRTAEVIWGSHYLPEMLPEAKSLRLIQVAFAGVDRLMVPQLLAHKAVLANARGIHGTTIAEHVFMLMLALARQLPATMRAADRKEWTRTGAAVLEGSTMGIVGYGSIGQAIARRAKAFGMQVLATRRHAQPDQWADQVWDNSGLPDLLRQSDYVILATPLTTETYHLIGSEELAMMKDSAVLVNIARGAVVDEKALIACLQAGGIRGAGLDVFETEPLPADSPLWSMPNVVITPHQAGSMPDYDQRAFAVFMDNLKRLQAGEPLLNVVDKQAGY
ncbi:MAG: D-2-hydroxyacid dehydrogenase [Bacillota bacterium]|jgi:phosphoglycerate dehydrogenase-like enzyme